MELWGKERCSFEVHRKMSALVNRILGPVTRMGEGKNACKVLISVDKE
jgi:hypothetical protein